MTPFIRDRTASPPDEIWLRGAELIATFKHGKRLARYCREMYAGELQKAYDEADAAIHEFGPMPLDERFEVAAHMIACEAAVDATLFPWPWGHRFIRPTGHAWLAEHSNDWRALAAVGDWEQVLELCPHDHHARKHVADNLYWELEELICGWIGPEPYSDARRRQILRCKKALDKTINEEADDQRRSVMGKAYNVDDWMRSLNLLE